MNLYRVYDHFKLQNVHIHAYGSHARQYSPFHLIRTASRSDRLLRAMRALLFWSTWPAAIDPIWTLLVLNENGLCKNGNFPVPSRFIPSRFWFFDRLILIDDWFYLCKSESIGDRKDGACLVCLELHGQMSRQPKRFRSAMLDLKGRAFCYVSVSLCRVDEKYATSSVVHYQNKIFLETILWIQILTYLSSNVTY